MRTRFLLSVVLLISGVAKAAFQINLDTQFSGNTIQGSTPYAVANFSNIASSNCVDATGGCVQLTLTAPGITTGEFLTTWDFNVISSLTGLSALHIKDAAGNSPGLGAGVSFSPYSQDAYQADGDGLFDFGFDFPSAAADRFIQGDSFTYFINGVGATINADTSFNARSTPGGNAGSNFLSAVHVQGIPNTAGGTTCSGWAGDSGGTVTGVGLNGPCGTAVPEPAYSSVVLTGGLIGFAFLTRRFVRARQ